MCQYSTSTTRLFLYTGNVVRPKMVDIYKTTCYWRMKLVSLQACCPKGSIDTNGSKRL